MFRRGLLLCVLGACSAPPATLLIDVDAQSALDAGVHLVDAATLGVVDAQISSDPPVADAGAADAPGPWAPIQMRDVSAASGIDFPIAGVQHDYFTTGQAWGDADGDGWQDLFVTSPVSANRLYLNRRDGTFAVMSQPELELADSPSGGAVFVDFDNDGDKDLYVLGDGPNRLFENRLGAFVDITATAGVGDTGRGQTASWGDYDEDGFVDLYVANWGCEECAAGPNPAPGEGNLDKLYHNSGDGSFTDVSTLLGFQARTGLGFVASFVDYDNDGDSDIYLSNDKGVPGPDQTPIRRNVLWRNDGEVNGSWHFEEVAAEVGADMRVDGMGLATGDIDNDGDLDFAVTESGPMSILRNTPAGFAAEILPPPEGVAFPIGWGVVFADFDNDGWLDLHEAVSSGANQVFHNVLGQFEDISVASGAAEPGRTHGLAAADYDQDGRVDLAMGNWGQSVRLYRNLSEPEVPGPVPGWLRVELKGGGPVNRDAIGARVSLARADGLALMQEVKCGSSLGSGNELALHFGLGASFADVLTVTWPDGTETVLNAPASNQRLVIEY